MHRVPLFLLLLLVACTSAIYIKKLETEYGFKDGNSPSTPITVTAIKNEEGKERVICPECQKLGLKSTVTSDGYGVCTAMYCGGGLYDEEGEYQAPWKCNTCSFAYTCSNGHSFGRTEPHD